MEDFVYTLDIVNFVIDDRSGMIQVGPIRDSQHEPNAAAIKKSHVWRRFKQKRHAQNVAIKLNCAIEILYIHKDLADLIQRRADRDWAGQDSSPLKL